MALYQGSTNIAGGAVIEDVVDLTSDQTITGHKAFNNSPTMGSHIENTETISNNGEIYESRLIGITTNTNGQCDGMDVTRFVNTAGDRFVGYRGGFYSSVLGTNTWPSLYLGVHKDGTTYSLFQNCDDGVYIRENNKNNQIITTTAIAKAETGYLKMGNGIIIQWGKLNLIDSETLITTTFPTPFSNDNYRFTTAREIKDNKIPYDGIRVDTYDSTTFGFYTIPLTTTTAKTSWNWIAIGY